MKTDTAALLEVARTVAVRCGRLIADERPAGLGVADTKSSPVDVVTVMDRRSEELAAALVRELRPGDGLLGEEGAFSPSSTGVSWLIDPIDGTVNYLYGIPEYSVSVAAVLGDPRGEFQPIAGAVYQPDHEELYWATADGPAMAIASLYGLSQEVSQMITGIILFFLLGSEFFVNYTVHFRGKKVSK